MTKFLFDSDCLQAIKSLRSSIHILITKPDKGSGIVILNRSEYNNNNNNNNNNKQFSIPLRQIFTSKKWLHQSGSGIISVNKINTSSGLADTNKDRKHAKHQNSKCTNIYKRKKTKHKSKYIQTKATVLLTFNKYYLI